MEITEEEIHEEIHEEMRQALQQFQEDDGVSISQAVQEMIDRVTGDPPSAPRIRPEVYNPPWHRAGRYNPPVSFEGDDYSPSPSPYFTYGGIEQGGATLYPSYASATKEKETVVCCKCKSESMIVDMPISRELYGMMMNQKESLNSVYLCARCHKDLNTLIGKWMSDDILLEDELDLIWGE